jgi:hypothetical protein
MPSRVKVNEYMSCENSGEKPGIRNLMQQHSKKTQTWSQKRKEKDQYLSFTFRQKLR